jgi:hypothetical protein
MRLILSAGIDDGIGVVLDETKTLGDERANQGMASACQKLFVKKMHEGK